MEGEAPPILYHYTDLNGLLGILDGRCVWATHSRFVNDASELHYGFSMLKEIVDELGPSNPLSVRGQFLRKLVKGHLYDDGVDCYVACFCDRDDILSQWMAYAKSGSGFAIGFYTKFLDPSGYENSHFVRKVIYDQPTQRQCLSAVLTDYLSILDRFSEGVPPASDADIERLIQRCWRSTTIDVATFLPQFKHSAFEHEKEWRICHIAGAKSEDHVRFRQGKYGLTPYIDIRPKDDRKLPIASVKFGTNNDPNNLQFALEKLLKLKGHENVPVTRSDLPIRLGN